MPRECAADPRLVGAADAHVGAVQSYWVAVDVDGANALAWQGLIKLYDAMQAAASSDRCVVKKRKWKKKMMTMMMERMMRDGGGVWWSYLSLCLH
jgi:hypothetical protein